jgi:hypothetical protein
MNATIDLRHFECAPAAPSLEAALGSCGWIQESSTRWTLVTERGIASLVQLAEHDAWRHFALSGGATPTTSQKHLLHDQYLLRGPAKFITGPGEQTICRIDALDDLTSDFGDPCADLFGGVDAHTVWARAVTAIAAGHSDEPTCHGIAEKSLAEELHRRGWSASIEDGHVVIHLQLPSIYRQLTIRRDDFGTLSLGCDLVGLTGLDDDCQRAMQLTALEANSQLPLSRLVVANTSAGSMLRAEVAFGHELIGGSFLLHSLNVMERAVAIMARAVEALRDVELARIVLSAANGNFNSSN